MIPGGPPSFIVEDGPLTFLVNSVPRKYADDADMPETKDQRYRRAFIDHKAWLSVDFYGEVPESAIPDGYRLIGKLASQVE